MADPIRIATRSSPLAQAQAHVVGRQLQHTLKRPFILIPCLTQGDRRLEAPLFTMGGKGLFVKEVELALLAGRAELAVHALKDMPIVQPSTLPIQAILKRTHPSDVWIGCHPWTALPSGAIVGTSSPRRHGQILRLCPQAKVRVLRGNIDTRLQKLADGHYDAIILAEAGLLRRGDVPPSWTMPSYQRFGTSDMLPAAGQGALALQCAPHFKWTDAAHAALHDADTAACVDLERKLVAQLGAQCQSPLAVLAQHNEAGWHLQARVCDAQGNMVCTATATSDVPQDALQQVYQTLLAQHAPQILQQPWPTEA